MNTTTTKEITDKNNFKNPWIQAARPKTLFASVGPVILGTSIAFKNFDIFLLDIFVITLLCALLLQISSNYINDYFDSIKGTDNDDRLGPIRVTQHGLLTTGQIQKGFITTLGAAFFLGLYLMINGGTPIILIGLSSMWFAYAYTGGPFPLSYNGLGEVAAFIFFGPVAVMGSSYLQSHVFDLPTLVIGCGVGFISALILAINNLRDIHSDAKTTKKTLAVVFGEKFQRRLALSFLVLANLSVILFSLLQKNTLLILTVLLVVPFIKTWKHIYQGEISKELNNRLAETGKYLFLYCLILSALILIPYGK